MYESCVVVSAHWEMPLQNKQVGENTIVGSANTIQASMYDICTYLRSSNKFGRRRLDPRQRRLQGNPHILRREPPSSLSRWLSVYLE